MNVACLIPGMIVLQAPMVSAARGSSGGTPSPGGCMPMSTALHVCTVRALQQAIPYIMRTRRDQFPIHDQRWQGSGLQKSDQVHWALHTVRFAKVHYHEAMRFYDIVSQFNSIQLRCRPNMQSRVEAMSDTSAAAKRLMDRLPGLAGMP